MRATTLTGDAVARVLRRAGVPLARGAFAATPDQVPEAFRELSAEPAVLKASGLLHKTELGGVVLGLRTPEDARSAAKQMHDRVGAAGLPFLVQEQASGMEMLVGLHRDRELGAAVVVGLGGVQAEIHNDVAYRFAPVTAEDALEMLQKLRSWPLLDGYRGAATLDAPALCDLIVKVSALALDDPTIVELDLNPVILRARGQGCLAVDARIITGPVRAARVRRTYDLERLLRPKHIAVVGVSDDETKIGSRLFRYLVEHDFNGRLDPVHPSGGEINGHKRYAALTDIEGSPDLVCVAVPARAVTDVARQAVAVGAGAVLVHSSNFAEVGGEGRRLQDELAAILAENGVPLVGPNAMGIVAPADGLAASISGGLEMTELRSGRVGLLTSSGALGSCIATRLMGAGTGLSRWVHVGNEADLVIADFLESLVDDPQTSAVGLLLEDIKDGPRLVAAGRRLAAAGKPTFAYNMGRSERGRQAALSHTGAMLASFELREELIRSARMVSLPSLRVLEDALMLSAAYELPRGNRLAAITFSGGAGTIIADEAVRNGIDLPELSATTRQRIRAHVPSYAAVRNPMDVSYQMISDPDSFVRAMIAMLAGEEFDAALLQFTTNADPFAERLARAVLSVIAVADVPVYVSRFGGTHLAPRALKVYEEAGIPVLDAPDRATQAIAAVMSARRAIGRR